MEYSYKIKFGNTTYFGILDAKPGYDAFKAAVDEFIDRTMIPKEDLPAFDRVYEMQDGSVTTKPTNNKVLTLFTGPNSFIMSPNYDSYTPKEYKIDDKELVIELIPMGYRIKMGKSRNFFGDEVNTFFMKFTSRNLKRSTFDSAKSFKTLKSVLGFVKKNEYRFRYVVKNSNIKLELDYTGGVANAKDISKYQEELENLINDINSESEEKEEVRFNSDDTEEILEGIANEEEMKEEALKRMKLLRLHIPVIKDFPKRLWKSEGPGILYYLPQDDEETIKAIEDTMDDGMVPYHAIVTPTRIGTMISVLTVSKYKEDWKYERPNKDGFLSCHVYNGPDICEYGRIRVLSLNGGLQRDM